MTVKTVVAAFGLARLAIWPFGGVVSPSTIGGIVPAVPGGHDGRDSVPATSTYASMASVESLSVRPSSKTG